MHCDLKLAIHWYYSSGMYVKTLFFVLLAVHWYYSSGMFVKTLFFWLISYSLVLVLWQVWKDTIWSFCLFSYSLVLFKWHVCKDTIFFVLLVVHWYYSSGKFVKTIFDLFVMSGMFNNLWRINYTILNKSFNWKYFFS